MNMKRKRLFLTTISLLILCLSYISASPTQVGAAAQAANIDQCRNGAVVKSGTQTFVQCTVSPAGNSNKGWVNGNAGASDSHYAEGESISYRAGVTGLTSGDNV